MCVTGGAKTSLPTAARSSCAARIKARLLSLLILAITGRLRSNNRAASGNALFGVSRRRHRRCISGLRANKACFRHIEVIEHVFAPLEFLFEVLRCRWQHLQSQFFCGVPQRSARLPRVAFLGSGESAPVFKVFQCSLEFTQHRLAAANLVFDVNTAALVIPRGWL